MSLALIPGFYITPMITPIPDAAPWRRLDFVRMASSQGQPACLLGAFRDFRRQPHAANRPPLPLAAAAGRGRISDAHNTSNSTSVAWDEASGVQESASARPEPYSMRPDPYSFSTPTDPCIEGLV